MPELPEITVLARDMQRRLVGRTIVDTEVLQPKCLNIPVDEFQKRLAGAEVLSVAPRGKWLQARTTRGWLLINLGMGGEILLTTRNSLPDKHRIILDLDDGSALAVNLWWFGYVHCAHNLKDHAMTAKLGPHALDLSLDGFRALLSGRRGGIKSFLLNQERIAGIGNVYVQDPLFAARIHPLRRINTLSDAEVDVLYRALIDTLEESIRQGGSAREVNLHGDKGRWDSSHFRVAYREGLPCPACGATVVKIRTGSTASHICPSCQPLPAG
jgi:formamidopyrimidine-DNA glycosylase